MTALRAALNTVLALPLLLWAGEILAIAGMAPTTSALAQTRPLQGNNLPNPFNQEGSDDRVQTPNGYTMLFVNPTAGVDQVGSGGERQPLRTITYALEIAAPNTVIVLAPGTYSAESGEQFPLNLKPGVTVQGNPSSNVPQAVIRGGGDFVSPTLSLQNVTIVAADRSGLAHVMVSNPSGQGQGVWIEAGSPVLLENVFAGSGHAGIFIAGQGEPMIARNHFYQNAVAGLVIYGASTATVQENLFEQTGVGITVSESAMPRIINNRIVQNREGIVLLSGADPVLEGNDIRHNRRNGVVDFGDAPAIAAVMRPTPSANTAATTPAGAVATETVPGPPISPADPSVATQQAPAPSGQTATPIPEAPSTAIAEPPASASSSTAIAARPTEPPAAAPAPDRVEAGITPAAASLEPSSAQIATGVGSAPASPASAPPSIPAETAADPVTEIAASPPTVPEQPASTAATSAASLPDLPAPTAAAPSIEPLPSVTEPSVTETSGVDAVPLAIGPTPDPAAAEPIPSGDSAALPATGPNTVAANNTAATPSPNADPGPDVDALFARLNLRRPGDLSRPLTDTPDNREQTASPTPPNAQPDAVEIAVIPPTVEAAPEQSPSTVENDLPNDLPAVPDDGASLPQPNGDVLRVPNSNVPIGSPGGMANVVVPATLAGAGGAPPSPPSRAAALGLYYRVLVEAPDETTQNQVRSLVSDAFRTRFQGRVMMQTGAYEEESVAIEMVEMLQHYGLDAQIEDIRQN